MIERFPVDTAGNAVTSWKQPIVVRTADKKLYLYLPKNAARIPNRNWIKSGFGTGKTIRMPKLQPRDHPAWAIANQHFELVVNSVSRIFSQTDVFMQFNISERCSSSCQSAKGIDCVCSCLGTGHGGGIFDAAAVQMNTPIVMSEGITETHVVVGRGEKWRLSAA